MKKIILSAIMLIGLAFSAQAQEISKNAIGLRIGDNDGFGAEVSYQRKLGTSNRLELDLGLRNRHDYYGNGHNDNSVKLVGLYQWVWNIDGGFNWYAGVGGGVGSWNHDGPKDYEGDDSGIFLLAAGDIGIEYNFDIPLMISLDFRPEIYFADDRNDYNDNYNSFGPDVAVSVRYRF
ncbi:MAG: hypothetical protein ABWZ56_01445 [Flavobacterium sp.]